MGRFHLSAASCFRAATFVFRFTPLNVIGMTISEFICTPNNSSMAIIIKRINWNPRINSTLSTVSSAFNLQLLGFFSTPRARESLRKLSLFCPFHTSKLIEIQNNLQLDTQRLLTKGCLKSKVTDAAPTPRTI